MNYLNTHPVYDANENGSLRSINQSDINQGYDGADVHREMNEGQGVLAEYEMDRNYGTEDHTSHLQYEQQ
jgi:hypothetical protein